MSKNTQKKDWLVIYKDMYGDSIYEDLVYNMTADEIVISAENNWPKDRAIEDYTVKEINEDGKEIS